MRKIKIISTSNSSLPGYLNDITISPMHKESKREISKEGQNEGSQSSSPEDIRAQAMRMLTLVKNTSSYFANFTQIWNSATQKYLRNDFRR